MEDKYNIGSSLKASSTLNNDTDSFKISVIITIYNKAEYLPVCLDSVTSNTYKNLEIILVNDGSTDNSIEICKDYAANDSRIKIISQKNSGVSVARNNGLAHASGNAVHFLDGDDYLTHDFYALLAEAMIRHNTDIVYCNYYNEKRGFFDTPPSLLHIGLIGKLSAIEGWLRGSCCMLIRTDFLRQHEELKFDTEFFYGEDTIFLVKSNYYAKKVSGVTDAIYYHRFNPNSVTHSSRTEEQNAAIVKQQLLVGEILDNFAKKQCIPLEIWCAHKQNNLKLQMKHYSDVIQNIHNTKNTTEQVKPNQKQLSLT